MLNKLTAFIKQYDMVQPGDTLVCAVSGGADSVALLFALYLLKEKLEITLEAAHFNHHLRGKNPTGMRLLSGTSAAGTISPCILAAETSGRGRRAWKRRPGMPGMPSCAASPVRSPRPIRRMTMRKRCCCTWSGAPA